MESHTALTLVSFGVLGLISLNVLSFYSSKLMIFPDIIWVLLIGLIYGGLVHFMDTGLPELSLSPSLVLYAFVPPLIFASTQKICLFHFRRVIAPASILGSLGILISMSIIAAALHYFFEISWLSALLFGAIISATDPLAIGALLNSSGAISESRKLLIEGESILNDGFVVTIYGILTLSIVGGQEFSILTSSKDLLYHTLGSLIVGIFFGRGARFLLNSWKEEHFTLTINMTVSISFGSFALAETMGFSGILAVFFTALAYGYKPEENSHDKHIHKHIWEYIEYISNAILFFLLGSSFFIYTSFENISYFLLTTCLILLIGSRLLALIILYPIITVENQRLGKKDILLLNFSGARGAVSIALLLLLPDSFELKHIFLTLAFVMIVFSLIAYPLTMKKLLQTT